MTARVPKEYQPVADQAEAAGWKLELTQNNHWSWTSPDGTVLISPGSPGDRRGLDAHKAALRRAGLPVDGRPSSRMEVVAAEVAQRRPQEPEAKDEAGASARELRKAAAEARAAAAELTAATAQARELLDTDIAKAVRAVIEDPEGETYLAARKLFADIDSNAAAMIKTKGDLFKKMEDTMWSRVEGMCKEIVEVLRALESHKVVRMAMEQERHNSLPPGLRPLEAARMARAKFDVNPDFKPGIAE